MGSERDSKTRKFVRSYTQAGPYISLGMQFAASIVLCLLGGWWLDEKVGTSPLFLILGIFLGSGAGFYNLYKTLVDGEEKRKKEEEGTG